MSAEPVSGNTRRDELLQIAAGLFADKGFKNTTVRDIADASGILSGSLYHHFDSKESMVDEILSTFQAELFGQYDEILGSDDDARTKLEQAVRVSFEAIDQHRARGRDLPERGRLPRHLRAVRLPRRAQRAVPRGLDARCSPRASSPARCAATSTSSSSTASSATPCGSPSGGTAPAARSPTRRSPTSTSPSSSTGSPMTEAYIVDAVRTPVGKRGGALAGVHSADLGAHTCWRRWCAAPASTRAPSTTSSWAAATPSARRPATSPAPPGWWPGCPTTCPG